MPRTANKFKHIKGKLGRPYQLGCPIMCLSEDSEIGWKDESDLDETRYVKVDDEVFLVVRRESSRFQNILRVKPAQFGTAASAHAARTKVVERP